MDGNIQTATDAGASPNTETAPNNDTAASPPWHESILAKDAAGVETLKPYAEWSERAPAPLREFINANMTAARAKTEGMVKVPGADAKPEDWDNFYKGVGRPDKAEDYVFEKPEKMPDGVAWDDAQTKAFAPVAHKIGLTPSQVKELSAWQIGHMAEMAAAARAESIKAIEAEGETLKKLFPGESGISDAAMIAQRIAGDYGIPREAFDPSSGNFWGPEALKLVVGLGRKLSKVTGEATVTGHQAAAPTRGYEWAGDVMNNPKNPDYARYHDKKEVAFQKEVFAAFSSSPPGWMPARAG